MSRQLFSWFRARRPPLDKPQADRSRRLCVEELENRINPSGLAFLVDNPSDVDDNNLAVGQVTLREAIRLANSDPTTADVIYFSAALANTTITMTGPTYAIMSPMTITAVYNGVQAPRLVIDGGAGRTIFNVDDINDGHAIDVTINGLTMTNGASGGEGGAIRVGTENLNLFNSTVSNSVAAVGGGISLDTHGTTLGSLTIANSTISGNAAGTAGGGIFAKGGKALILSDTISGNTVGGAAGGLGGGVESTYDNQASFTNCTIVNNQAIRIGSAGDGGGVGNDNSVAKRPIFNNTIVAGNTVTVGGVATASDLAGLAAGISSFNLIADSATSGGLANNLNDNIVGNDGVGTMPLGSIVYPKLTENGGTTKTHALVPNSPAINRGSNALAIDPRQNVPLNLEQRGQSFPRVVGASVDIGAVELQATEASSYFDVHVGTTPPGVNSFAAATAFGKFSLAANSEPDLAVADATANTIGIYLNTGAGGFASTAAITLTLPTGANPASIVVADFNADGKPDLAVANSGISGLAAVSVFINTTTVPGTPTFATRLDLNGPSAPIALAAVNIDGDASNNLDLVVLNSVVNSNGDYIVSLFLGDGLGGFSLGTFFKIGDNAPDVLDLVAPTGMAVGDLSGSALPEILVTASNGATLFTNASTPGSPQFTTSGGRFISNAYVTAPAIGKLDGDALNDFALVATVNGNSGVIAYRNLGGSFSGVSVNTDTDPFALQLVDVNADGKNDIVVAHRDIGVLSVIVNTTISPVTPPATLSFANPLLIHTGGLPIGLAVADINQDTLPDIAVANGDGGTDLLIGNAGFADHSYVVDTLADVSDGNFSAGNLSLREAITLANLNPGRDTISFAASLNAAGFAILNLASDLPTITDDLSIVGLGANNLSISGQGSRRIFTIDDGNNAHDLSVSISGLRFQNGSANGGGAILSRENLKISNCLFLSNQSTGTLPGGAITAIDAGSLDVSESTFTSNSAGAAGGGAIDAERPTTVFGSTFTSNSALNGGAIDINIATTTITDSTFNSNSANATFGLGGAIRVASGTLNLANSTLFGNSALNGGGFAFVLTGAATITNATIVGNHATAGGGLGIFGTGIVRAFNTLVSGNFVNATTTPNDISGTLDAASANNLIGDAATSGGLTNGNHANIVGNAGTGTMPIASILSTTLADNGGQTKTLALVQNSLALGAGSDSVPNYSNFDQRETARDIGAPDIGAFETQHPLDPVGVPSDDSRTFLPQPSTNANVAFVKGLYQTTLLRSPDPGGQDYWVGQLNAGVARQTIAMGFVNSYENRSNQVNFFYNYFLHRASDSDGLNYHVARLQKGVDEATVMSGFILSNEFSGQNNTDSFVNLMYYAILGRQAEPTGFAAWKHELDTGHMTREQVVNGFLRSSEGIGRVVQSYFLSYLKRPADSVGLPSFINLIGSGTTFGTVAAILLASDDFYFGHAIPNRG